MTTTRIPEDELQALIEADTLHLLPTEALIATIKNLAQVLLQLQQREGSYRVKGKPVTAACKECGGGIFWIFSPTGSWWAHIVHPVDDEHDAEPSEPGPGPTEQDYAQ